MKDKIENLMSRPSLGLHFKKENRGAAAVFHCRGAFSLGSYPQLNEISEEIRKTQAKKIVLNLRDVVYIDSTGLGTLATALKDTRGASRDLVLVPSREVREVLTLASLEKAFQVFENVDDALRTPGA